MNQKWREKFKFSSTETDCTRDTKLLNEYYKGMRSAHSCALKWNEYYSTTLTDDEFINMANSLGYSRGA